MRICPPVNLCRSSTGERGSGGWFSTPGTSSRSFPFGARLLTEVAAHSGETEKPYPERVMARRCEASQRAILLWRRERFPAAVAIFPSKSNRSVNQKVGENPKSKHVWLRSHREVRAPSPERPMTDRPCVPAMTDSLSKDLSNAVFRQHIRQIPG